MPAEMMLVAETPDSLMAKLTDEWNQIKAQQTQLPEDLKLRKSEALLKIDVSKGETLVKYNQDGLSNIQLKVATEVSLTYITFYLRYGRFLGFLDRTFTKSNVVNVPTERYFRELFKQKSDAPTIAHLSKHVEKIRDYEEKVFHDIAQMLKDGFVALQANGRKSYQRKKSETTPTEHVDKKFMQRKRKEVRESYEMIEQDVKALIALMGADRSTYAPDILSMHAKRLKRGFIELQKALKGDVDAWVLEDLD